MEPHELIRNLDNLIIKHANDTYDTFATRFIDVFRDCRNTVSELLEKTEKYEMSQENKITDVSYIDDKTQKFIHEVNQYRVESIIQEVNFSLKKLIAFYDLIDKHKLIIVPESGMGDVSDGYHTFNELYHHRAILFSVICRMYSACAWKSKLHDDGTMYPGMFIVGIETPEGSATYHYDIDPYWDLFNVKELPNAPKWDGHSPAEAINRIGTLGFETSVADLILRDFNRLKESVGFNRPEIVCLCGSTRFKDTFIKTIEDLSFQGKIVLSVGMYGHVDYPEMFTDGRKEIEDELHKRKIDLCDRILVLNVGGYIGESTRNEINYAILRNKEVTYLEPIYN